MRILKNTRALITILLGLLALGFKTGELVEITDFLNARRTSDVRKKAQNKLFALAPETLGRVESVRNLRHGNSALQLTLTNGPHTGKKVWVFFDSKNPRLKLFKNPELKSLTDSSNTETLDPQQARSAGTTQQQEGVNTDDEQGDAEESHNYDQQLHNIHSRLAEMGTTTTSCPQEGGVPVPQNPEIYPESQARSPKTDRFDAQFPVPTGIMRNEGYTAWVDPSGEVSQISFANNGGNSIVSGNPQDNIFSHNRDFRFYMPGGARQELMFQVTDDPGAKAGGKKGLRESYFAVFPRKVLPSIKVQNGFYDVTLPTSEVVRFKADTHEIVGGVLSEGPLTSGYPAIRYRGAGVIIRADAFNDDARTDGRMATISKPQTNQSCKVSVSKLWTVDGDSPRFRFPSDEAFNQYLQNTCGFSI